MDKLRTLYYNKEEPTYLASSSTLRSHAPNISTNDINKFLKKQKVATIHAPINRRKKPVAKYISTFPFKNVHIDTLVFSKTMYFLTACCTFSNYSACQFIGYTKKSQSVLRAFQRLFESLPMQPTVISSDSGTEMSLIPAFLAKYRIKFIKLKSFQHSYYAERLNRSIRSIFRKIKTHKGAGDIRELMPQIIKQINMTPNRITKLTPLQMLKPENAGIVFRKKYADYLSDKKDFLHHSNYKFTLNQPVRLYNFLSASELKSLKSKESSFTSQIFYIHNILPDTYPPSYIVRDSDGFEINRPIREHHLIQAGIQNE